jgi:hypothetical protein
MAFSEERGQRRFDSWQAAKFSPGNEGQTGVA